MNYATISSYQQHIGVGYITKLLFAAAPLTLANTREILHLYLTREREEEREREIYFANLRSSRAEKVRNTKTHHSNKPKNRLAKNPVLFAKMS
jgi:hypothetical protein